MTSPGWSTSLLFGLGAYLGANSVGAWTASGAVSGSWPIVTGALADTTAPAIRLSLYGGTDDFRTSDVVQPVQLWFRGSADVASVNDRADLAFALLHGAGPLVLGGVPVVSIRRVSWMPMGFDGAKRAERADNYYLRCQHPSSGLDRAA